MGESRGNGAGGMGVGVGGSGWVGVVGAARFELTTSCSRSKRATKLRHAPTVWEAVGGELYQKSGRNGGFILHRFASVSPPLVGGGGGGLLGFAFLGFRGDEFLGGVVVGELLDFLVGESDGHGGHQRVGPGSIAVRGDGFDEVFGVLSGDMRIDGLGADAGRAVAGDANGDFAVGDGHILRVNGDDNKSEKRGKADAEDEFHGWGFGVGWRIGSWEKTGWRNYSAGRSANQIPQR